MAKILIVDDEPKICELIAKYAAFEGYETETAADGMQAVQLCRQNDYDLIIMDVMMPELDGFSATREIRKTKQTPIIMLSARGEEYDRIHGFELGVDDYVQKPFSPRELMMRVDAILRRFSARVEQMQDVFQVEGLCINCVSHIVTVDGKRVDMSPKEYELLLFLMRHPGQVFSREDLYEMIWGLESMGDNITVAVHIGRIREKLEDDPASPKLLQTVWGVGYRLRTDAV